MINQTPTLDDRYIYAAQVVRVVDGDTVVLNIDLGCGVWLNGEHCRLAGIDAPEKRGEDRAEGFAALHRLQSLIEAEAFRLIVRTYKDRRGKYGRWIVELWTVDGINLNERMVSDGFAREFSE